MDERDGLRGGGGRPGHYSNYFKVGYNSAEFIVDFGQFYAETEAESMHTRIVTAPVYAKALIGVLQSAVAAYEEKYGSIPPGRD